MNAQQVLSGIIAAEAQVGNTSDQFGVASTIQNRVNQGFAGSSGGALGVATAPGQYTAYENGSYLSAQTTPYTDNLASALLGGDTYSVR